LNNKSIVSLLPRGRHHLSQPALVPLTRAGKGDWGVVHLWEGVGKGEGGIGSRHKEEGGRGAAAEAKPPAPPLVLLYWPHAVEDKNGQGYDDSVRVSVWQCYVGGSGWVGGVVLRKPNFSLEFSD